MARVLVVDDERQILELLAFTLGLHGHEVHTALSGVEALEKFDTLHPELVILDILMRPLDGFDTARALRALPEAPRIIFLSGFSGDAHERQGRALGDAYLVKPCRPALLLETVAAVLAGQTVNRSETGPITGR